MLHALLTFAAETTEHLEETSKVPFYALGGLLAVWAVVVSAIGIKQHDFPRTQSAARGVMAISGTLVLAAMASAILTS